MLWYINCSGNSETGGTVVPPRPSDHRDVGLLVITVNPEEPEGVTRAIAGERGLHRHHVAAVTCQADDEDALQPPFQRQPELFLAAELLVQDGHRAWPEHAWPRQGAQPAAGVSYRALAGEDGVLRERSRGFRRCGSGGVECDRLVGAVGDGRGTVACRTAGGCRGYHGQ
uniref:Uncharacterized protein n=1 Tax=Arundo donax TaxID=35708 RepID=A0A0A9C3H2_ARUDO